MNGERVLTLGGLGSIDHRRALSHNVLQFIAVHLADGFDLLERQSLSAGVETLESICDVPAERFQLFERHT